MKKRGQFFLIAALVIIAIVLGLAVVYNSIKSPNEDTQPYDLSKEINLESSKVIEQGVNKDLTDAQIDENIAALSQTYSDLNPNSNLLIVYSNSNKIMIINYTLADSGSVSLGDSTQRITKTVGSIDRSEISGNFYTIKIKGVEYTFDLTEGRNFYIVLAKEKEDEKIVASQ